MFFIGVYMEKIVRKGVAIVSTDDAAYQMARSRRTAQKSIEQRIATLENEIATIKQILSNKS